jgi:tetratricopeptide (TPR) repeat protein
MTTTRLEEKSSADGIRSCAVLLVFLACLAPAAAFLSAQSPALETARVSWERRSAGFAGEWAPSEPILEGIESLDRALQEAPEDLDLYESLMRALYYQGTFTELTADDRKAVFGRGTEVASAAVRLLHGTDELRWKKIEHTIEQGRGVQQAGPLHYWAAILWGSWGDHHGAMAALRKGVADRLRIHGQVALELAPDYDFAGPYRFLGRMHAVAPRVPGFTGWIDREKAVELLEEGYRRAPEHPQNGLFLAEIWLEQRPAKKQQAVELLEQLLAAEPRKAWEVEDEFVLREVRETTESLRPTPALPHTSRR